ncbi:MFS transporter [Streptomyces lancefieldiae]|uniref:MFS transporter n=1 Tax=Streptomyces lancefieldiae TaxID=3075520 RepID=A0ABU3AFV0_9ACTN|nr:MFS transporter [Streptomyces sp. DSM 40712]MDT0609052.1 MFS transporter [Streptomyces sp. DSM 40712]
MSLPPSVPPPHRPGPVLFLLAGAQFLVVLNTSIVNVALPAIGQDLRLAPTGLAWVVNAYLIAFGALLPVGGRLTDLLGHRTAFLSGLLVFASGSLAASIPSEAGPLIAARAVQGIGAALLSPAGLAILLAHWPPGPCRGKALGIWGAASAAGGAAGVLLGGVLTSTLGWWAVFAVSALLALPGIAAAPPLLGRGERVRTTRLDAPGALVVTAGLTLLVYGLGAKDEMPWPDFVLPAAGSLLLLTLVPIERRVRDPLLPPALLRNRPVVTGNLLMLLLGAVWVATFFFLPLYQQKVLGYSPLEAGLTQVPLAAALMAASWGAGRLRGTLLPGLLVLTAGLLWLARLPVDGAFLTDLLGPSVLIGSGLGLAFVPLTALGVAEVDPRHAGIAGGLINTSRQMGGALGLAILTTLANPAADRVTPGPSSLAHGYRRALVAAALIALLASAGTGIHLLRGRRRATVTPPAPAGKSPVGRQG